MTFRSIGDIATGIVAQLATGERWLPVVGYPGYEVSDQGRVRSLDRVLTYCRDGVEIHRAHRGRLLSPGVMQSGHLLVVLGRGNVLCVHKLVLEAFVGPAPAGTECCHYDGDPANNRLSNLRWDTRAANMADAVRHGTHPRLKGNHCA